VSAAYLDTSVLLAIAFGEPQGRALRRAVDRFDHLLAGDLLVAEALSAALRERVPVSALRDCLQAVSIVLPDRSLEPEMREALGQGVLRGADLWHVACAAFVAGADRGTLAFLTRDGGQRRVARRLGFPTP